MSLRQAEAKHSFPAAAQLKSDDFCACITTEKQNISSWGTRYSRKMSPWIGVLDHTFTPNLTREIPTTSFCTGKSLWLSKTCSPRCPSSPLRTAGFSYTHPPEVRAQAGSHTGPGEQSPPRHTHGVPAGPAHTRGDRAQTISNCSSTCRSWTAPSTWKSQPSHPHQICQCYTCQDPYLLTYLIH